MATLLSLTFLGAICSVLFVPAIIVATLYAVKLVRTPVKSRIRSLKTCQKDFYFDHPGD